MSKFASVLIPVASIVVLAACATGPSDAKVSAMVRAEVSQVLAQMRPELIGPQGPQGEPGPPGERGLQGPVGLPGNGLDADQIFARVRAESFQSVSEAGTTRAVLALADGEPMVGLLGTDSGVRGSFSLTGGSPQLALSDDAGSERATLALERDGSPFLWLGDPVGNLRIALSTLDDIPALTC